ncbi:phage major capsid protein [Rhodococcus xishaensis]|uniref:Phage major capsid protein n=1 Tax=Rhodococcus xishaensis TaxID=2487364 RepID=A0A438ARJ8_9NOCA|nr:phage major capsid protein [Rhodococcus xishaensis]RVW01321.1 phage major capsid protein [Rhodococcus xishaensis]
MAPADYTSTAVATAFTPDEIDGLVVQPTTRLSVAMQAATAIHTSSTTLRIPVITDDPSGSWVGEGEEIPVSDLQSDELTVTPSKLATLSVISSELADDSSPEAQEIVGQGIARDVAGKIDAAFFGDLDAPAPKGLAGLTGVSTVDAGDAYANTDPFAEAISKARTVGATLTAWVANPTTALTMAKVKKAEGSNEPLLGNDPTEPTKRTILGLPLEEFSGIPDGVVWGIPVDRVFVVMRKDTDLKVSDQSHFTSDQIAIRAITRVGFGFPHPSAIVKISTTA